jgi:lipopolysaccharide/colanic/teichoic acid biosynthesis glycosyltransferase
MSTTPSTLPTPVPPWVDLAEPVAVLVHRFPRTDRTRLEAIQRGGKRVVDLVGAGLGLLVLAPLMLVIGVLIRLGSKGPALFRQTRLGRDGRPFEMYKYRTMVVDAEERLQELESLNESPGGVLFKMRRDPRVTRFGRILRRSNLDELPQLFNVLKGEMSLVGPRPLQMRDCVLLARAEPDAFVRRHEVPPGLTGPWQVSDRRETDHLQMLRFDLDYLDRWSLWLDLWLIVQTVVMVLTGRPARGERPAPAQHASSRANSPA